MGTIWKSTEQQSGTRINKNTTSGTMLSSWSRQQKIAMLAGFAIVGLLLVVSACSKQASKPALVAASGGIPQTISPTAAASAPDSATGAANSTTPMTAKAKKKAIRKNRPADVLYSDANSGVSFAYPRKAELASGDAALTRTAGLGDIEMNFTQPGGVVIAAVELPADSYPGTDFASAMFNVNVNRGISEPECSHFAFVDTRTADGEAVDAERVKVGGSDMETTSSFTASMMKQSESQYYHRYENGACYEYVLSLGTAGYGAKDGIGPVDREAVFGKLEKILDSVTIKAKATDNASEQTAETLPSAQTTTEHPAAPAVASITPDKK